MFKWSSRLRRRRKALVWALILLAGLLAGVLGGRACRERLTACLADQAKRCAAAVAAADTRALAGTREDLTNRDYASVKERLALLQSVSPNARLLSLVRFEPGTGKVVFLDDSGTQGAGLLLPGDTYSDVSRLPALQRVISSNLPSAQGPLSDGTGTWAMGFAAVTGGPPYSTPARDILDLDVSADGWSREEWGSGFHDALYTWLLLGLPFGVLIVMRGRREQRTAFRNVLSAVEQSQSAVMIVDLEGCIEYVNASLCAQIGYSRRELLGRPWRDFQQTETLADRFADMVATVRSGNSWSGEWFNRRRIGDIYPVRGAISPVKNRDGTLVCFIAVFDDMTELKRGEAALRSALGRAEAGDRAKNHFLATMSHEVRTPLNGIVGFTSLLLGMPRTPEQDEYIQIIRANGETLIQLTGDILDFAHIESGSLKLELKPCGPRACVEATLDLLAAQAAGKKVELLHWVDDNVPASVAADEARLRQVLVNLAGNAVKFTEEGEVEVTVRAVKGPAAGVSAEWMLTFSVRDTGIGISAADHEKLFKPFSQVDVSSTRRYGGTGLGLAISKNLVELMGGTISVESGIGRGSTFTFTLPAAASPAPARAAANLAGLRLALAAPSGPFRREFARLAQRWGTQLTEVDSPAGLAGGTWDAAFVEVGATPDIPGEAGGRAPWPADKTYAIVPMSLARELRSALRAHFCQIINKPLHHDAIPGLLAGARPGAVPEEQPSRFDLRVLVAEDNIINQRLVQKLLGNLGCTSTIAENGRAAIEELARGSGNYDLVLMDLHMPELDGLEAIQKIRAGEAGEHSKTIWIAALTADARAEQRERVVAAGGSDYLVKPIKLGELSDALRRYAAA